jgi:N-acetylmuramoyl-L-alanine amidase
VTVQSHGDWVHITGKEGVLINGGGSYIKVWDGGIEEGTEQGWIAYAVDHDYVPPKSMDVSGKPAVCEECLKKAARQASALKVREGYPMVSSLAGGNIGENISGAGETPVPVVELVELNALLDAADVAIADSTAPHAIPHRHPMSQKERPEVEPRISHIAHRELKIRVHTVGRPANVHAGKRVTWSMTPLFTAPGAETASFRGNWDQANAGHRDRFEASFHFGDSGFARIDQERASTTVDAEGYSAIRVNLPPIGFNAARIRVSVEDHEEEMDLADLTVPAVIVIDPGHGGMRDEGDSGWNHATSIGGTLEKDLTLDWGTALRDRLDELAVDLLANDEKRVQVVMTRTTDINRDLSVRANFARDYGADIFMSLHFNGWDTAGVRGPETWIRRETENRNYVADRAFAQRIQTALDRSIPDAPQPGVRQPGRASYRGIKAGGLGVLSDASLGNVAGHPMSRALLVEVEFITNQDVEDALISGANAGRNRQAVIDALADAILDDIEHQE